MNFKELLLSLSKDIGIHFNEIVQVSGGDIADAYRLSSHQDQYFIKLDREGAAFDMFEKEKLALEEIARFGTIQVPEVYRVGRLSKQSYILMEYIEAKPASQNDFIKLADQLAQLHSLSKEEFGWEHNNYIGTLPQSNSIGESWADFYVTKRLLPQIKLAVDNSLLSIQMVPKESHLIDVCYRISHIDSASPVHGDLWSGNYLIRKDGTPYLFDPAFYYGHPDVDIAMSLLFGGIGEVFYDRYFSILPKQSFFEERISLFQLYHLLVHLNIFGISYLSAVERILKILIKL